MAAEMLKDGKEAVQIQSQGEEHTAHSSHHVSREKEEDQMRGEEPGEACQCESQKGSAEPQPPTIASGAKETYGSEMVEAAPKAQACPELFSDQKYQLMTSKNQRTAALEGQTDTQSS